MRHTPDPLQSQVQGREGLLGRGQKGFPDGLLLSLGLLCQLGRLVSVSFSRKGSVRPAGKERPPQGCSWQGHLNPHKIAVCMHTLR